MNNASLELGGTNWAEKDGNILGYSVANTSSNFYPQEFTFARGSNLSATRIDRAGLIVKGRENVLLQSNQFDTTWVTSNSSVTSGQSGYDGTNDAWLLNITGGSCCQFHRQTISTSGVQTFSMYVKSGTLDGCLLFALGGANPLAEFDLATGSTGGLVNNAIDSSIEDVGDGWYRCSITFNQAITQVRIYPATAAGAISNTSGNILIQDAQLEQGLAASPYIETTTTSAQAGVLENTPRLNYTTGVANPYLLLEPSRTNVTPNSENFFTWSRVNSSVSILTANQHTSPEGLQNAFNLEFTEGGGQSQIYKVLSGFTIGTKYTQSLYVKYISGTGEKFQIVKSFGTAGVRCTFTNSGANLSVIAVGGTQAADFGKEDMGNGWFRIYFTYASNTTNWEMNISRQTGSGNDVYAIYGHQLEAGSYPTSYIPTYSVSATRASDLCNNDGVGSLFGTNIGSFFLDAEGPGYSGLPSYLFDLSDNASTGANRFGMYSINTTTMVFYTNASRSITTSVTARKKIAVIWNGTNTKVYLNGAKVLDFTYANANPTSINLSSRFTDGDFGNSKFNQVVGFPTALTDAEAITLTTI